MTHTPNQRDPQGLKHGVWELYYTDGALWERGHYHHGEPHGLWEWYRPDGHLLRRGHYHHGVLHGLWEWYHSDGTPSLKRYHLLLR